jgi:hypothetical protein
MGAETPDEITLEEGVVIDFAALRGTGLLWLINKVVFHPRGFAFALQLEDDGSASGWTLLGDGTEPWRYEGEQDGRPIDDVGFERAEAFLAAFRPQNVVAEPAAGQTAQDGA